MKPLGEVIRRCGLWNHQYADDTQLYLSFSTNPGLAVAVLNRCLAEVMGWMRANTLKLNPDKTEVLLVGGSGLGMGDLGLVLNGVALPLRDRVHRLGVLLDPELSLEAQVTAVARSVFLQLRLIHQLRPFLENDCLATVTHALVTSRLDFCNALYVGLPLKTVQILQLVQNRAARLLTGTGQHIMRKAGLDESPVGIKIAGRHINNLRYTDDTTLMAESEEELKSLLMQVKEESAKVGLKFNIKKTKIMASGPIISWQIDGEEMEVVTDFIFLGSKITTDGDLKDAYSLGGKYPNTLND
ncbi:putative uncharacterized transposon-derived protein F52C9.6 [Varanus komodoensis]|nr:putative uncharacterized transposon-derived protein F52C9.6 [Varanus komodoensis]